MSDTPYSNMTIWALEQERDKIVTELKTRYLVRGDAPRPEERAHHILISPVRRLVDQIRRCNLVDEDGHDFNMNAAFIVVEALCGMAPRAADVIDELPPNMNSGRDS